ncbi:hypothetical protein ACIA8K_38430 [Catenuloplanes sp. NPDC051500]|uniref:hypothetical protein n=1 Tax=Catenuloplanes sp. NPDC051500 TaxID=3363959 RepID=UPI0037B0AE41
MSSVCAPWDTGCLMSAATDGLFGQFARSIVTAEQFLIDLSASWWVLVPSLKLFPDGATGPGDAPIEAVANLRGLLLPLTAMVAVGGVLWNSLLLILTRKPAPLVNVLRGLWNTALWSAAGLFGTNLLLHGADRFTSFVLLSALGSVGDQSFARRLSILVVPQSGTSGLPVLLVIVVAGIATVCALIQAVLMPFRDVCVLLLAPAMPLAAAGSFTGATSGWLRKVLAWQLALIFYKPAAALVYASAIWLQGDDTADDPRVLLMGVALMIVALIALPALLRLFTWTVGSTQSGGGGFASALSAGAAGLHAAASLRDLSGGPGSSHSRYDNGPPRPDGNPPPPGNGPGPVRPPTFTGGGPGSGNTGTPPGGTGTSAGTTAGTRSGTTAGTGQSAGTAAGTTAAAGPAAPVVIGTTVAAGTAARGVASAAGAAADTTAASTEGE